MKKDIHPKYFKDAKVICSCGNSFVTGSTMPELKVEICAACHPFYTGTQKLVDTEGRVEKYQKKQAQAERLTQERKQREKKRKEVEKKRQEQPKTLKDLLKKTKKVKTSSND